MSTKVTDDTVSVSVSLNLDLREPNELADVLRLAASHPDGFARGLDDARRRTQDLCLWCIELDDMDGLEAARKRAAEIHAAWMTLAIVRERL